MDPKAWARGVGAAPTGAPLAGAPARGSNKRRKEPAGFRPTERDVAILALLRQCRALTGEQIRLCLWPAGPHDSRCQHRLTLLYRHGFTDRLPRAGVNQPAVYLLSRRAPEGLRLLQERGGQPLRTQQLTRLTGPDHLLAVNAVRVRVLRGVRDLGWELPRWQSAEELRPALRAFRLIPDGYFQVRRQVGGEPRLAGFFLEVERESRSLAVLRAKLRRYGQLFYSGGYAQRFGSKALRVLVVYAGEARSLPATRVAQGMVEAGRLGVTIARFTDLVSLTGGSAADLLLAPLWQAPGLGHVSLFPGETRPA